MSYVLYRIQRMKEERMVEEDDTNRLSPIPEFEPKWNSVVTFREKDDEVKEVDRRSWINIDNQPLRYTLDALDLPQ
mgnify:CR=1 FL=1